MKKIGVSLFISFSLIFFLAVCSEYPTAPDQPNELSTPESDSSSGSNVTASSGIFRLVLTDKPADNVKYIYVKVDIIRVHKAPGNFIQVAEDVPEFDLLELKNNPQAIVETELEAGHYNQIRMSVESGRIIVDEEGVDMKYSLDVPSGEIKIPVQFQIEESGKVQITLDFDADKSIKVNKKGKNNNYRLRPVIKVTGVSYS
jgi:hypothetical protein